MATPKDDRVRVTSAGASPYDTVEKSERIWVTGRGDAVRLRMTADGISSERPISVPSLLIDTATKVPNHCALAARETATSPWQTWTYHEYLRDVKRAAKGFIKLGLEPLNGVGILGFNAPQWHISLLGGIFAGGISTGIYTTNGAEAVHYVLEHSQSNIVVVEDDAQLRKVLAVRDRLPHLKAAVQYRGAPRDCNQSDDFPIYSWKQLLEQGDAVGDDLLEQRLRLTAVNKCCSLIYTSGTTGQPKGVMLSHDNTTWTAKAVIRHCRFRWTKEVTVSYLPLSHIAAQLTDIFVAISAASTVHFAQPDALKGSLGATLKEVRPTAMLAVPRVWEKMQEKLREVGKQTKGCKKKISTWAKGVGLRSNMAMMNGQRPPASFHIANALVFKKVKKVMGLDRCHSFYSGAAPISRDTVEYFMSLNIPISEIYGMSESTGPQHIGVPWDFTLGTVGPEMPGARTDLVNEDKDGNGEACFSGRHVFMGYLDNEEKTRETIDEQGRLHSGDIGKFNDRRHLSITGRIKELLITAGGENVAPVPIEENVKHELPVISNCMLIGDKRKFLSILLTLKTVVDPDTMVPGDRLTPEALDWVQSVNSSATTVSQILQTTDVNVMRAIQAGIERANKNAVSRAQKIQKWSILPIDFSVPGGELGPSLKLKRPVATKIYSKTIEAFYRGT